MNIENVIEFLEQKKLEDFPFWFETVFQLGAYSGQDTDLEKEYELLNGKLLTIVDKEHTYSYVSLSDTNEECVYDCYITFENYKELIEMIK